MICTHSSNGEAIKQIIKQSILPPCSIHGMWGSRKTSFCWSSQQKNSLTLAEVIKQEGIGKNAIDVFTLLQTFQ